MPAISLSGTSDHLESEWELFEFLTELKTLGWRGTLATWSDVWELQAHIDDASVVDGRRSLKATVGDWKIVLGTTISVMTPTEYAAAYGV